MGHAGPLQHGDYFGIANAVCKLLVAGRVEKYRTHHPHLKTLHFPVVIDNILDNSGRRSQNYDYHFSIFGSVAFHNL